MIHINSLDRTVVQYEHLEGMYTPHRAEVNFTLSLPHVAVVSNFLAPWEVDHLKTIAEERLHESTVVNNETGEAYTVSGRVSQTAHLNIEHQLIRDIEYRIEQLTGVPKENGEAFQVQYYKPGGFYSPHYDFFDPEHQGSSVHMRAGGQRIATVILYLSTPEFGGSTVFPHLGLNIRSIAGSALYFHNVDATGQVIRQTLHGGEPVGEGSSPKWIATKWIRQNRWC